MLNPEQLHAEFEGDYHPVFVELKKLEREYPKVHKNQDRIVDDETAILINTYASLLYSAQDEAETIRTPREIRDALLTLQDVNGFRQLITDLVQQFFPAVILVVERLYYQNRAAIRYFDVPASDRPAGMKKVDLDEWVYPEKRIDKLRNLSRKIWRECVLEATQR